jgi:hypothetical protein
MAGALDAFMAMLSQPSPSQNQIYQRNQPYVAPGAGGFNTQLSPLQEMQFRNWVGQNNVPFDASAGVQDYDMRGFWNALQNNDPRAASAVNQNDGKMHFPDYWKTPYHESFSNESQWAGPVAPMWNDKDQLVAPNGRILYDERKKK